jgi:hypothetical protein
MSGLDPGLGRPLRRALSRVRSAVLMPVTAYDNGQASRLTREVCACAEALSSRLFSYRLFAHSQPEIGTGKAIQI